MGETYFVENDVTENPIPESIKVNFPYVTKKTPSDFSYFELLFKRPVFFKHLDAKGSAKNSFKFFLLKHFHHNMKPIADVFYWMKFIFEKSPEKYLVVQGPVPHVVEMLRFHYESWTLNEIELRTVKRGVRRLLFFLAKCSIRDCIDYSEGSLILFNVIDPFLIRAYRILHPNKKIFVRIHDDIKSVQKTYDKNESLSVLRHNISKLLKDNVINHISTYNKMDSEILNVEYSPNSVSFLALRRIDAMVREYIYVFIGAYSEKVGNLRLTNINILEKVIQNLYPSTKRFVYTFLVGGKDLKTKRVAYSDYISMVAKSEVVVDFYRIAPDEGWSFRISEAIALGRKIITNRSGIKKADFYHPSRVFIFGEDSFDDFSSFIEGEYLPLPDYIKNRYNSDLIYR